MSFQLDYAAPTPPPFRPGCLALGAGILAFAPIAQFLCKVMFNFFLAARGMTVFLLTDGPFMRDLSVLAAIPLLAAALPPASASQHRRRKMFGCLALAVASLLFNPFHYFFYLVHFDSYFPFGLAWLASFIAPFLKLALVVCADVYLLAVGRRLDRPVLGVIAAGALSLTILPTLTDLLDGILRLWDLAPAFLNNDALMEIMSCASTAATVVFTLLWISIALFALILARTHPRSIIQ